ncbi:hypothetical protein [Lentzea sp. E54]|uniref:hypothetical protein n=1 Tax=Lentzea xerophila TaxID=3435883 RepID=UPI003DA1CA9E
MTSLLTEAGKRVSAHWLTAILLPGLLLVAVAATGFVLGHAHALDLTRLSNEVSKLLKAQAGQLVVTMALAAAAAGVLGSAAGGIGKVVQRWWLRERFLTGGLITRSRWSRRSRAVAAARLADTVPIDAYLPKRPTWIGDRVRLVEARVRAEYHVSAALVWPRVWLLLTEDARRPISDARARYADAVTLTGWGTLYLTAGLLWWPALIIGSAVWLTAWQRARGTVAEHAELVESAIDVHLPGLGEVLGVSDGKAIDDRLRKSGQ